MAKSAKQKKAPSSTIALNRKAKHEFFIEERFEAGIVLEGWEAKALRAGKLNLTDSYVFLRNEEAFISNALITPLQTASTHVNPNPTRVRKLLLHRRQISQIHGAISQKGYTCVALAMYWSKGRAKCEIALAKGKQKHDKRAAIKEKDWNRDKQRILRTNNR